MLEVHERARAILRADEAWSAYGLANLRPDLLPYCAWTTAGRGLVLVFSALTPPIVLTVGPVVDVATALEAAELPPVACLSARTEHLAALRRYYEGDTFRSMVRMTLPPDRAVTAHVDAGLDGNRWRLVRLGQQDVPAIEALIAEVGRFAPDGFAAFQVADGHFFGVRDDRGRLWAVGGTHVVNRAERVAAIGNVCTHPDVRGRGYAVDITARVVADVRAAGMDVIVLNVNVDNEVARRLYARIGFVERCVFLEGEVRRRGSR